MRIKKITNKQFKIIALVMLFPLYTAFFLKFNNIVHEFGHWFTLKIYGLPTNGFTFGKCPIPPHSPKEVFLGGPAMSIFYGLAILIAGIYLIKKQGFKIVSTIIVYAALLSIIIPGTLTLIPNRSEPTKDGTRFFYSDEGF